MTGAPSKKPWWVRAFGGRGRAYTVMIALALTITGGSGLRTSLRHGNVLFAAISIVAAVLAIWLWAVVFWELRHRGDSKASE